MKSYPRFIFSHHVVYNLISSTSSVLYSYMLLLPLKNCYGNLLWLCIWSVLLYLTWTYVKHTLPDEEFWLNMSWYEYCDIKIPWPTSVEKKFVRYRDAMVTIGVGIELTHWCRDQIPTISQTTFSNAFSEWKCMNFSSNFTEACF